MDSPLIKLTRDSIQQITELLGHEEDEQLRLDVLEGETQLFEVVGMLIDNIEYADGTIAALKGQVDDRKRRIARLELKIEQTKQLIQSLMETANISKIPLPQATVFTSFRKGGWKIVDDQLLPTTMTKTMMEIVPDKDKIAQAVENGQVPKGVLLTNGGNILNIRRK